ncbi:Rpn family recombination-promoting nuclease/putative transposase [bacterium 210820-DFI.6.37]|nr:Rpn family recombination-promoting nuclease/putative transposase [bacterium 210820-DFI.6.37]
METRKEPKALKDLNLLDRFLFAEAAENPEFMENLLRIVLGKSLTLRELPQAEKESRKTIWSKQIRLDVWSIDQEDTVYDTEVQKKNTGNLPKRSRLYHGMIDSKLLPPGELDYNRMPDSYVIMIMPFDLMGRGLYRYTFEMICREIPELRLEDGATRIFLNTHGTVREDADQELIDMLRYMECTTAENAERPGSKRIQGMHEIVENIRSSEEIGVRYMQDWEEKALERQEGRKEGREKGHRSGFKEGRNAGLQEGADEQKKAIAKKLKKVRIMKDRNL